MEKLNKYEAFTRAVAAFGAWRTWSRSEHVAYGLIRGVPYSAMERYCNDAPQHYNIASALLKLGAWPAPEGAPRPSYEILTKYTQDVAALVVWVRKPVRVKRERPVREPRVAEAVAE